jgi:hypothetical protein
MYSSSAPCHIPPLRSKYFLHHSVPKHLQCMFYIIFININFAAVDIWPQSKIGLNLHSTNLHIYIYVCVCVCVCVCVYFTGDVSLCFN